MPYWLRKDAMATAQNPNDLTRQQLDELDALLQKMLALPLNASETAAPTGARPTIAELPLPELTSSTRTAPAAQTPPPFTPTPSPRETAPTTVWRGDSTAGAASTAHLLAMPALAEQATVPMTRKAPNSNPQPADTLAIMPGPKLDLPPEPLSSSSRQVPRANPIPPPLPVAYPAPEPSRVEHVPPMLAPLVGFNRALNGVLGRMGPLGLILRSGFGKNLLAAIGVVLLALTAAKIAQLQGWISLSTTLPWLS